MDIIDLLGGSGLLLALIIAVSTIRRLRASRRRKTASPISVHIHNIDSTDREMFLKEVERVAATHFHRNMN